jgi:hypothetical protein
MQLRRISRLLATKYSFVDVNSSSFQYEKGYWRGKNHVLVLDYEKQKSQTNIIKLQSNLPALHRRNQREQSFPLLEKRSYHCRILSSNLALKMLWYAILLVALEHLPMRIRQLEEKSRLMREPYAFRLSRPFQSYLMKHYICAKGEFIKLAKP